MVEPVQEYRLVLVTGPSGAGRTTAINALEDMGYEVIDNLPLSFVPRLIEGPSIGRPIALGLDVRNRDFNATALIELIDRLTQDPRVALEVLYVDCSASELIRRYNQTRRRHPLAPAETPAEGVEREIDLLAPVRVRADHLIDTSEMSPHDLKAELSRWFDRGAATRLAVSVQSFSYKRGVPRGVDMIFDCRFLKNPYWVESLRALDGREASVADYISSDPRFGPFFEKLRDLVLFLLPAQLEEGKAHLSLGFGCTGGQHRSVAVAELLGNALAEAGWPVSKRHRELERRAAAVLPTHQGEKA
ncbi:RNase adapter RapZ [Cereibacter sphaeroides]|uniref:RNase adapter RapZ n=1 Tax=Cereibacter sphaeroides TaxID=1063 RepID=A0AAX1UPA9_CERSP|nr:RNase adapter RapZ [Cereibacter sphaeroides]AZB56501.1 RNase adapter RapZ [Cereibacter sphaeroides]AZB60757.1 RNase adapter RapZ [Cereibacter sphaeroides]AZB64981.1 RNase adapter RapZ [Cereibacter sphaeroides]AZB67136.1 RNase adapter RapZ [Cereibacter sphaeroides]MWP40031.1 RNase adapter RapZ [Cereibacter sphaeroides]